MADGNLDVMKLAAYLHLGPQQVMKLAERGEIPGAKSAVCGDLPKAKCMHGWSNALERVIAKNSKRFRRLWIAGAIRTRA